MKKLSVFVILLLMASFAMTGCKDTAKQNAAPAEQQDSVADSTLYGVCGEATTMHELELITDAGDTLMLGIQENDEGTQDVKGGLLAGDRLAVIASDIDGEKVASRVINLTTLQGHWTSLDKNFVVMEDGTVKSNVQAEKHPWTSWKIVNGLLLLNTDTFQIDELGSDSLYLENREGIFVYKRQK